MHPFGDRGNALLTFAFPFLAFMCAMASLFDNLLNSPSSTTQIQVSITMNISADLKSLFTWNTKQVQTLWVGIIPSEDDLKFYDFIVQGNQFEGKRIQLDIGLARCLLIKLVMSGYRLPEEYR